MSKRILLIEDDDDDRQLFHRLITPGDTGELEFHFCTRLVASLATIREIKPHLVLLDLNLPDSRGVETLQRIKAHFPDQAVVVLTGQEDRDLASLALAAGARDILVKGHVTVGAFKAAISNALRAS